MAHEDPASWHGRTQTTGAIRRRTSGPCEPAYLHPRRTHGNVVDVPFARCGKASQHAPSGCSGTESGVRILADTRRRLPTAPPPLADGPPLLTTQHAEKPACRETGGLHHITSRQSPHTAMATTPRNPRKAAGPSWGRGLRTRCAPKGRRVQQCPSGRYAACR